MKKNLLKVGVLVAVAAPLAINLASCGQKVPSGSESTSTVQTKFNCQEEARKNNKVIVVNFWHSFSGPNEEAVVKLVDNFNEKALKDANSPICVTPTATGKYEDTLAKVTAALGASTGLPDLVTTYPDHVAAYNAQGAMVNFDKFQKVDSIALSQKDLEDFYPGYLDESYRYVFNSEQLDSYNTTGKGGFYSLPLNKSTEAMYYNKTFFDVFTKGTVEGVKVPDSEGNLVDLSTRPGVASEAGKKQYGADMKTNENNKISFTLDGKKYEGFPWGQMTSSDGSSVTMKHPDGIKADKVTTYWTFEDFKVQGAIYRAISNKFVDFETGKLFKENVPNEAEDKEVIKAQGNFLTVYDSLDNLFVTTNVSAGKYTTIEKSENKLKGKAIFNSSENKKLFTDLRNIYNAGGINSAEGLTGSKYGNNAIEKRQAMISVGSTAGASHNIGAAQKGNFVLGTAPAPVWNNKDNKTAKIIQQGTNISMMAYPKFVDVDINSDSEPAKKQKAAWEFVKYATSTEGSVIFSTAADYLPIRKSTFESKEYQAYLEKLRANKSTALKADVFSISMTVAKQGVTYTDLPFPGSSETRKNSKSVVRNVMVSKDNVDNIINKYCDEQNAKYSKF